MVDQQMFSLSKTVGGEGFLLKSVNQVSWFKVGNSK